MSQVAFRWTHWVGNGTVCSVILCLGMVTAYAETVPSSSGTPGRIDFADANLPPATVEVDLKQEIFHDLFGLGDAAIAGIVESLTQANVSDSSEATELAAENLTAARQILQLAKEVVSEVRVPVYEDFSDETDIAVGLAARFDQQLHNGQWDNVVKIRDGNESGQIALLRVKGSILGVFVAVADDKDVVLVNVVCDVSPENVKKLTSAATKIGLKHGLQEAIEHKLNRHLH